MTAVALALRGHALRFAASEAGRGAALALALKVLGSALNIVMLSLLARTMDAHAFGFFALWFNGLLFLAVVAGLGQEKLVLRSWSEYSAARRLDAARGALRFGLAVSVAGGLGTTVLAATVGLAAGHAAPLVASAAALLVLQTLYKYSSNVSCAVVGIASADGHDATWRGVVSAGALLALVLAVPLEPATVFALAAVGTGLAIAAQLLAIRRALPADARAVRPRYEARTWSIRSAKMAAAGTMEAASEFLEVVLVGIALGPVAAGGYFVAARLAGAFSMITGGLHSFANRQISRQHYGAGPAAVHATLRSLALVTGLLVLAGGLAVVAGGTFILGLFGPGYVDGYLVLLVLSLGTAVVALGGPAPTVLLVTGHEGIYSLVIAASVGARLATVAGLALVAGPLGAACGSAAVAVATAIVLNIACRRLAGVDPAVTVLASPRKTVP